MNDIQVLLVQIAVILLLSRLLGAAMRLVHQPMVVGEMIAGIALGPSLLGLVRHGHWMNALFPPASLGHLGVLSQLGVMLFMFLVGLELDPKLVRGQGRAAVVIGSLGIVVPFAAGLGLGLGLARFATGITGPVASPLVLGLFVATAMSITAFPVLARILTERNLHKARSGALALTCAAINDVLGWCILAFVLAVAHVKGFGVGGGGDHAAAAAGPHRGPVASVLLTLGLTAGYVTVMVLVVGKLLGKMRTHYENRGYVTPDVLAILFLLLIGSSVATDLIGVHQIFGAFMLGAVMPKEGMFLKHLTEKIEDFTLLFLLPLFFAYTGLKVELGLLSGGQWAVCALIVAVAVAGKFGGVSLAARTQRMSWRKSALLGVLMNTRGLMELIILDIGLSFGVLSKPLFAMMVVMALATTFMTTPLMRLLYSPARQKKELEEAARDEAPVAEGVHVVVPVSLKSNTAPLVKMGGMLIAGDPGRLYAVHLDRPDEVDRRSRDVQAATDEVLDLAQTTARADNVPINTLSFVARNVGRAISEEVNRYHASWVVMGWHKPVFFKNLFGGVVGQVLRQSPANVAVLVNKGIDQVREIMVPYVGEAQDRGALLAAERLGRAPGVKVTILHVVKPNRDAADARLSVRTLIDREVGTGGIHMKVVESDSPIEVVVEQSRNFDLLVLGLSPEWNLKPVPVFGKSESVAQRAHCSLLIVHANPNAPVVPAAKPPEKIEEAVAEVAPVAG